MRRAPRGLVRGALLAIALVAPRAARAQPADGGADAGATLFEDGRVEFERGRTYYAAVRRELVETDAKLNAPPPAATSGLLPLPVLFYGPETELGVGAFAMYYLHLGRATETRVSSIRSSITGTTRGQVIFELAPEAWLANNLFHAGFSFNYRYFPDSYFGIGYRTSANGVEGFTERSYVGLLSAQVRLLKDFYAGVRGRVDDRRIEDRVPGKELAAGTTPGSAGGWTIGAGPALTYDTRDNVYAAFGGSLADVSLAHHARALGSDFAFTQGRVDLRHYVSLGRLVLAFQLVGEASAGDTPFYLLPRIGGGWSFRGIYFGRYRDNLMVEGQTELRTPLYGPFGGVLFLATGEVARAVSDLRPKALYAAGGGGLRFAIVPDERINIRLDFAYGPQGVAYYLDLGEAF